MNVNPPGTPQPLGIIGLAALSWAGDFRTSYDLAARCIRDNIPGDFVECGVFGGAQAAAMALAIIKCVGREDRQRRVHLFDSFEGTPPAGPEDRDFVAGGNETGTSSCSLDTVKDHMRQWGIPAELLVYHKGWFADTLRSADPPAIALLRLDGDLYESTKVSLDHLYPRLVPGGFCILDDANLDGCRRAWLEYMSTIGGGFTPITWQKPK